MRLNIVTLCAAFHASHFVKCFVSETDVNYIWLQLILYRFSDGNESKGLQLHDLTRIRIEQPAMRSILHSSRVVEYYVTEINCVIAAII